MTPRTTTSSLAGNKGKKKGFKARPLHRRVSLKAPTIKYLTHKSSFLIAVFSLIAFIAGNMMGEHGWHAFWASVLGSADDSLIVYDGTVTPIQLVPDYTKWSMYGGNPEEHTFRQVPKDLLIPLPEYKVSEQKKHYTETPKGDVYGVGNMGSYRTGAEGEGSHVGVDIRVPEGTPVRSIANGIVERVDEDRGGYGLYVVIRHPHMPDPDNPGKETVLHSIYAHVSAQLVAEGDIVKKGQQIALSGMTGFATGPHLHFQVDRDEAPYHPYWPFNTSDMHEAHLSFSQAIDAGLRQDNGYKYTVHPMLLVQQNLPAIVKRDAPVKVATQKPVRLDPKARAAARKNDRIARRGATVAAAPVYTPPPTPDVVSVVTTNTVATTDEAATRPAVTPATSPVATVEIHHDGSFAGRDKEIIRIILLDAEGRETSAKGLTQTLYLRTAYGEAQFDKDKLTAADFKDSVATVGMLPLGRRTVHVLVAPLNVMSRPMQYKGE